MTHSVPTAFNAVGTEGVTPGLPRQKGSCLGYRDGMGHTWATETDWVTPGLLRRNGSRLGYRDGIGHAWVSEDVFTVYIATS